MGPGNPGPVVMKPGEAAASGLPPAPARAGARVRWFGLGLATGVIGTLIVVATVATLTH